MANLLIEEKERIIAKYMATAAGRSQLAQAMASAIGSPRPFCPICRIRPTNLQEHCESKSDDDHLILSIHNL